jgi:phage terminase large subunit
MSSSTLKRKIPRAFVPLLQPARYKGGWGGRGSGKSHFFAEQLIIDCLDEKGLRAVCIREVQKTLAQSSKTLLEKKIADLNVGRAFRVYDDKIATPGDGLIMFQGMQNHTAESIKSLEGIKRAWVEEAQTLSPRSLTMLRPTIRADGSQIWFSWNPRRKTDAVDEFLRGEQVPGSIVVKANWRDNPWFPEELNLERRLDMARYPDRYAHIWEGRLRQGLRGRILRQGSAGRQDRGPDWQGLGRPALAVARHLRPGRVWCQRRCHGDLDCPVGRA